MEADQALELEVHRTGGGSSVTEHLKALSAALNGASAAEIPEEMRTTALLGVIELKKNYDELWQSYETEKRVATESAASPPTFDLERHCVATGVPYGIARIVLLLWSANSLHTPRIAYQQAKDYLEQLLRSS